jgi:hypothetical protein
VLLAEATAHRRSWGPSSLQALVRVAQDRPDEFQLFFRHAGREPDFRAHADWPRDAMTNAGRDVSRLRQRPPGDQSGVGLESDPGEPERVEERDGGEPPALEPSMLRISAVGGARLVIAGSYVAYYGWREIRILRGGSLDDPVIGAAERDQQSLANGLDRLASAACSLCSRCCWPAGSRPDSCAAAAPPSSPSFAR